MVGRAAGAAAPSVGKTKRAATPPVVSLPPARRAAPVAASARGRAHAGAALVRPPTTLASPVPVIEPAPPPPPARSVANTADPVDIHVGQRLRDRRIALGLSQSALAEQLGLTFQQVQKYERGANRLSASTLYRAAEAVDVPVSFFFDGLPPARPSATPPAPSPATLTILRRIAALPPAARTKVVQLLAMLLQDA